jgi:hypothetical protein
VLGRSATVENFHFAVTHSGVILGLRVAELVGADVRSELVDELAPFQHSRLDARQPPTMSADHGNPGRVVTITVTGSCTVITSDGQTCLPNTDVIPVDGVVRDLPRSYADRLLGQADLIIDATRKFLTPL